MDTKRQVHLNNRKNPFCGMDVPFSTGETRKVGKAHKLWVQVAQCIVLQAAGGTRTTDDRQTEHWGDAATYRGVKEFQNSLRFFKVAAATQGTQETGQLLTTHGTGASGNRTTLAVIRELFH